MLYNIITSDNFNISIHINIIKYSSFIYNLIENNTNKIIHLKHYSCSYIKLNKIFEFLNFHYFCQNKNDTKYISDSRSYCSEAEVGMGSITIRFLTIDIGTKNK